MGHKWPNKYSSFCVEDTNNSIFTTCHNIHSIFWYREIPDPVIIFFLNWFPAWLWLHHVTWDWVVLKLVFNSGFELLFGFIWIISRFSDIWIRFLEIIIFRNTTAHGIKIHWLPYIMRGGHRIKILRKIMLWNRLPIKIIAWCHRIEFHGWIVRLRLQNRIKIIYITLK
jgi:hypothetical protein